MSRVTTVSSDFTAFECYLAFAISSKKGRAQPMIFCAVFITLLSFLSVAEHLTYNTVNQYTRMLSGVNDRRPPAVSLLHNSSSATSGSEGAPEPSSLQL